MRKRDIFLIIPIGLKRIFWNRFTKVLYKKLLWFPFKLLGYFGLQVYALKTLFD